MKELKTVPSTIEFKEAYCQKYRCTTDHYAHDVLLRCVSSKAKYLVRILLLINPRFFSLDLELVEKVGRATTCKQVRQAISNYFFNCSCKRSLLHDKLHIRISTSQLETVAHQFHEVDESQENIHE